MRRFNIFATADHIGFLTSLGAGFIEINTDEGEKTPIFLFKIGRTPWYVGKIYGNKTNISLSHLKKIITNNNIFRLYYQPYILREDVNKASVNKYLNFGFSYAQTVEYPTKTMFLDRTSFRQAIKKRSISRQLNKSENLKSLEIVKKLAHQIEKSHKRQFLSLSEGFYKRMNLEGLNPYWQEILWENFSRTCVIVFAYMHKKLIHAYQFLDFGRNIISYTSFSTNQSKKYMINTRIIYEFLKDKKNFNFDFFGVSDERYPHQNQWRTFSEYKARFYKDREKNYVYYMQPLVWENTQAKAIRNIRNFISRDNSTPGLYYGSLL